MTSLTETEIAAMDALRDAAAEIIKARDGGDAGRWSLQRYVDMACDLAEQHAYTGHPGTLVSNLNGSSDDWRRFESAFPGHLLSIVINEGSTVLDDAFDALHPRLPGQSPIPLSREWRAGRTAIAQPDA